MSPNSAATENPTHVRRSCRKGEENTLPQSPHAALGSYISRGWPWGARRPYCSVSLEQFSCRCARLRYPAWFCRRWPSFRATASRATSAGKRWPRENILGRTPDFRLRLLNLGISGLVSYLLGSLAWLLVCSAVGREAADDVRGQAVCDPPEDRLLSVLSDQCGHDFVGRSISPFHIFARVLMLQDLLDLFRTHR